MDLENRPGVRRMTVGDVMTTRVLSVGPDTPFRDIATTLFAGAVRAVPVVDAERRLSWLPVTDVDGLMVGVLAGMLLVDPARVSVEVVGGVVTLAGQLDTRTDALLAVRFVDRLTQEVDARPADLDMAPLYWLTRSTVRRRRARRGPRSRHARRSRAACGGSSRS